MTEEERSSEWFIGLLSLAKAQSVLEYDASLMETSLDQKNKHGVSLHDYILADLDGRLMGIDAPKGVIPRDSNDIIRRQRNIIDKDRRAEEDKVVYEVVRRAKEFKVSWSIIQKTLIREYNIRASNDKIIRIMKEVEKEQQA